MYNGGYPLLLLHLPPCQMIMPREEEEESPHILEQGEGRWRITDVCVGGGAMLSLLYCI